MNTVIRSDDHEIPPDSSAQEWARLLNQGVQMMEGRILVLDPEVMKRQMEEAGFVDVKYIFRRLPIGDWSTDPKLRRAGVYQLASLLSGLESISIFCFTKMLGWSMEEFQVMMAKTRKDFNNRALHMYWPA